MDSKEDNEGAVSRKPEQQTIEVADKSGSKSSTEEFADDSKCDTTKDQRAILQLQARLHELQEIAELTIAGIRDLTPEDHETRALYATGIESIKNEIHDIKNELYAYGDQQ